MRGCPPEPTSSSSSSGRLGPQHPQSPLRRPPLASPTSRRVQLKPDPGLIAAEGRAAGWECSVPRLLKGLQNQCLSAHFPPNRLDTRQEATASDTGVGGSPPAPHTFGPGAGPRRRAEPGGQPSRPRPRPQGLRKGRQGQAHAEQP